MAVIAIAVTPGLLGVEVFRTERPAVAEEQVELNAGLLGHEVPEVGPEIPDGAPVADGMLSVPEDWAEPVPESALRSVDELPDPVAEVVEDRDAVTEVWENADGTETVRIHSEPVHFQPGDDSGRWERIDNQLVADGERAGWVRNRANRWTVRFGPIEPDGGGGVEIETGAGPARFAPVLGEGSAAVTPVVGRVTTRTP